MNIERQGAQHELMEPRINRRNGEREWTGLRDISGPSLQLVQNNGLAVLGEQARADRKEYEQQPPRPSLWSELLAGFEWVALKASPVYYGLGVPHGAGAPVILVPGFLGSDLSLLEMHLWLGRLGYRSFPSRIGRNAECPDILLERLSETISHARRETGQKVSLIGHSLGGLLARSAAGQMPDDVAQLITMGTPLRRLTAHPAVFTLIKRFLRRSNRRSSGQPCLKVFHAGLKECLPQPVPHTSICSGTDPIVQLDDCSGNERGRTIEVASTHIGMPVSPAVYREVAAALASPQPIAVPANIDRIPESVLPRAA